MTASTGASVDCSSDGSVVVSGSNGTNLFVSIDGGATFAVRDSFRNWSSVTCSSSGTYMIASVSGGYLYTSTDTVLPGFNGDLHKIGFPSPQVMVETIYWRLCPPG